MKYVSSRTKVSESMIKVYQKKKKNEKKKKNKKKKKKKTKTEALNAKSGQEKYQDEYKININRYQMTL